jgi:hypothetical protein
MRKTLAIALFVSVFQACDYATSNVQTLYTTDCGVTWKLIKAGESIPKALGMCSYKVTIPDYPMQGESKFKTAFKDKVLANVEVTYDYAIVDGIQFISEAKYLGKSNTSSDDETNASSAYETAENSVIDKRIKEVARELLINEDITDFSQSDFEDKLLTEVNKLLKTKGVELNFLSFVPIPDEQTRTAIDVATASKIYKAKDLVEIGEKVLSAKAGATRISVTVEKEAETPKE